MLTPRKVSFGAAQILAQNPLALLHFLVHLALTSKSGPSYIQPTPQGNVYLFTLNLCAGG